MRAGAYAALGIAAYFVFLLAMVPAAYVAAQLQGATRGLELTDARGTIWRGSARVRGVLGRNVILADRVSWTFRPARLLRGEIGYGLSFDASGISGVAEVARSPSAWKVEALRAEGDARDWSNVLPVIAPWRPAGPIAIGVASLRFDGRSVEGEAEAQWKRAAVGLSEVRPLGSYRLAWRAQGTGGRIDLKTAEGPLRVSGQGTTTLPLRVAFNGEARAEGEQAKALEPLLDLIGPRRPDGARAIELRIP